MAKYKLREEARDLRRQGVSVKTIAKKLNVSKGSISRWVSNIDLSVEQIEKLRQSSLTGAEKGRIKIAQLHKEKREDILKASTEYGKSQLVDLTQRELLIAGIALYWAEGGKKNRRIEFCNSDPKMIEFLLHWLRTCFNVPNKDLTLTLGINESHKEREIEVKEFWSNRVGVPLSQFYKTRFKKSENKKIYKNHFEHFGTLSIGVRKSTKSYYTLIGLIEGLYLNMPR